MAFIIENSVTVSFAEFSDVLAKDQRLFEANEGLTDDIIEAQLIRSTERILSKLRSSQWWISYYAKRNTNDNLLTVADVPALDPNRIKSRQNDFTDLCVYTALADFILPQIADFGNEDSAERKKMGYYTQRADSLFGELITSGDWYDFDDDNTISQSEREPGQFNIKRVR